MPTTLDDTYERALQEIPKEKRQHAHRLLQCLVAAIRPLHVEELAEIFAIRFDGDRALDLMEGWRPESPDEAVLSACSTLITVENDGPKIVQFSHLSVKEYLTSDRLRTSDVGNICNYHIRLDAAHTILAGACLTALLHLDENVDEECLGTFPLAFYAAQYWIHHAKFEDVALRIQDDMERLFNPRNPYLAASDWIYDVDGGHVRALAKHPTPPKATAIYNASLFGLSGVANYICTYGEDVNAGSGRHGTPLHAASRNGHIGIVRVLLDHRADKNARGPSKWTPLHYASFFGHADIVQLLLDHGADINALSDARGTPLRKAIDGGHPEVVRLLLEHGADVNLSNLSAKSTGYNFVYSLLPRNIVPLVVASFSEAMALLENAEAISIPNTSDYISDLSMYAFI
jgi:hypothetical protein